MINRIKKRIEKNNKCPMCGHKVTTLKERMKKSFLLKGECLNCGISYSSHPTNLNFFGYTIIAIKVIHKGSIIKDLFYFAVAAIFWGLIGTVVFPVFVRGRRKQNEAA